MAITWCLLFLVNNIYFSSHKKYIIHNANQMAFKKWTNFIIVFEISSKCHTERLFFVIALMSEINDLLDWSLDKRKVHGLSCPLLWSGWLLSSSTATSHRIIYTFNIFILYIIICCIEITSAGVKPYMPKLCWSRHLQYSCIWKKSLFHCSNLELWQYIPYFESGLHSIIFYKNMQKGKVMFRKS